MKFTLVPTAMTDKILFLFYPFDNPFLPCMYYLQKYRAPFKAYPEKFCTFFEKQGNDSGEYFKIFIHMKKTEDFFEDDRHGRDGFGK